MPARLRIPPAPVADVLALEAALGVSHPVAQVLVRRGLRDVEAARAFLAADERSDPLELAGIAEAVAVVSRHVQAGTRITVHGDYDVDGVCSTAILVSVLRRLGADVDWFLPSRTEDGYGLALRTVERLAARGTALLVTADCAITAVDEVAAARAAGMDVVVTDHHNPRADGRVPDAPVVHPALGGWPCAHLCAAGVAHKLAGALLAAAGEDPAVADEDLDLVALATVADCVPLVGENRRLVREGVRAIAVTRRVGLRALLRSAGCDPSSLTERDLGFRLAPRINAAGRLHRADAGVELMLTADEARADAVAEELGRLNADRREVEQRILWEAERAVAEQGPRHAHVVWGEGWHPGVVGIVASRLVERLHRPVVVVALDGRGGGTGSGRSIPAFDLLGGLDACSAHLERHGGHRAAAGCTVRADALPALAEAFDAHAATVLSADDLVPSERVDAVVAGDELGLDLAEELRVLAPFGEGNREPSLLVPAARLCDARTMGAEGRHLRFTVQSGGLRARAVAFGTSALPPECEEPVDATFALERNEWHGSVEPRLRLREALPPALGPVRVLGELPWAAALAAELGDVAALAGPAARPAADGPDHGAGAHPAHEPARAPDPRDRRGGGAAGVIRALVASGDRVLVVCADAPARERHLQGRVGDVGLVGWAALRRAPALAAGFPQVAVLDPPAGAADDAALRALAAGGATVHLCWGPDEAAFALGVLERELDVRGAAAAVYRALRSAAPAGDGAALEGVLAGVLPGARAGRALGALAEAGLVRVDAARGRAALVPGAPRTDLAAVPTAQRAAVRLAEARDRLGRERALLERPERPGAPRNAAGPVVSVAA